MGIWSDFVLRFRSFADCDIIDDIHIPEKTTDLGHGILHRADGCPPRIPPHENLKSPNEEMAYSIITNISAVYNQMGLVNQAKTLLRETIPCMAQSLGLVHRATAGTIYNFLLMERTSVPSLIIAMVQEIQENRYETGRPALEQLAGYYYETNQVRKAVGLMETLAEWEGIGADKSMSYLNLAGVCHSLLDNFDESCEKYELMCKRAP